MRDAILLLIGAAAGVPLGYYLRHLRSRHRWRYYV